jgi:hypothetical protein
MGLDQLCGEVHAIGTSWYEWPEEISASGLTGEQDCFEFLVQADKHCAKGEGGQLEEVAALRSLVATNYDMVKGAMVSSLREVESELSKIAKRWETYLAEAKEVRQEHDDPDDLKLPHGNNFRPQGLPDECLRVAGWWFRRDHATYREEWRLRVQGARKKVEDAESRLKSVKEQYPSGRWQR